jgi:hypothetical protein
MDEYLVRVLYKVIDSYPRHTAWNAVPSIRTLEKLGAIKITNTKLNDSGNLSVRVKPTLKGLWLVHTHGGLVENNLRF